MTEKNVRDWFLQAIEKHPNASNELKRSIVKNKNIMTNYVKLLHKELEQASSHMMRKTGRLFKTETIREFVKEMANNFVVTMEKKANEGMQSEIKRLQIEKEKQNEIDMAATFAGKPQGELKEYVDEGHLILDETQLQRPNTTLKGTTPR